MDLAERAGKFGSRFTARKMHRGHRLCHLALLERGADGWMVGWMDGRTLDNAMNARRGGACVVFANLKITVMYVIQ